MAAAKVLATYELLEEILHGLDPRDILLDQRVCRTWRDMISRSHKLQRALFLLPIKGDFLENNFDLDPNREDLWSYPSNPTVRVQVFANPMLEPLHDAMEDGSPVIVLQRLHPSWAPRTASWRKMLLSQPGTEVEILGGRLGSMKGSEDNTAGEIMDTLGWEEGDYQEDQVYHVFGSSAWDELEDNKQLEKLHVEASDSEEGD